eukprot:jgi/Ulvmu1/5107/UM021_0124.1
MATTTYQARRQRGVVDSVASLLVRADQLHRLEQHAAYVKPGAYGHHLRLTGPEDLSTYSVACFTHSSAVVSVATESDEQRLHGNIDDPSMSPLRTGQVNRHMQFGGRQPRSRGYCRTGCSLQHDARRVGLATKSRVGDLDSHHICGAEIEETVVQLRKENKALAADPTRPGSQSKVWANQWPVRNRRVSVYRPEDTAGTDRPQQRQTPHRESGNCTYDKQLIVHGD